MNQGFALYNYIRKDVGDKHLTKLCFLIVSELLNNYNKLVNRRITKNPKRTDMNLNPNPTDVVVEFNTFQDLELKIPGYFELYRGFVKRNVNNAISKWLIECKIQGTVIK